MKHSSNTGVHSENTVEEPIAVYSRSFVRGIRNMVLFLVVSAFILAWWLGISELTNILLPLGFLIFFVTCTGVPGVLLLPVLRYIFL